MSLLDRFRPDPARSTVHLKPPPMTELQELRARVIRLTHELCVAEAAQRRAERRAAEAEQHIAAQKIAHAATPTGQLALMQQTLQRQDDLLKGCRRAHGSNIRASALPAAPHPLAVCEWCLQPVADPLADCDNPACGDSPRRVTARRNAALAAHPDITDETDWKHTNAGADA